MSDVVNLLYRRDYPFTAITNTDVCPDLVNVGDVGMHRSAVMDGRRVWWFETSAGRDLFVVNKRRGEYRHARKEDQ